MTRRDDLTFAALLATALTLAALVFLLWCQARGYDDSMCTAYRACGVTEA